LATFRIHVSDRTLLGIGFQGREVPVISTLKLTFFPEFPPQRIENILFVFLTPNVILMKCIKTKELKDLNVIITTGNFKDCHI
jgi:hypothetical protein